MADTEKDEERMSKRHSRISGKIRVKVRNTLMIDKKNVNSMGRRKSKTKQKEKRLKVLNIMRRLPNMWIKVTSFRSWTKRCEVVFMKSQVHTKRC